jgi:NitT/TauT family transport system substrate-binding protein
MKKVVLASAAILTAALAGAALVSTQAQTAARPPVQVKLQLKWFPQSQFAGYFVAQSRGYFRAEGLDVTLVPAGDANPVGAVAAGAADFGTTWITDFLVSREKGQKIVHIAQMFQRSGFTLVTLADSGIKTVADLKGKKVGVWPGGNEYPVVALAKKAGLTTSLDSTVASPDITAVTYPFDPSLVFPDKVDAVSAMTYNEVNQIVGLGFPLNKLNIMRLPDMGVNLLEDLMFAPESVLANRNFKNSGLTGREVATRLIRASIKGWNWAVQNQGAAVDIVLPKCGNTCKGSGAIDARDHQTWQMKEIAKLYYAGPTLKGFAGYLDPVAYKANVDLLRDLGVLKRAPDAGAVDYTMWERATGKKAGTMK